MCATLLVALVAAGASCARERPAPPEPPQLGTVRNLVDDAAPAAGAPGPQARYATLGGDTRPVLPADPFTSASFVVPAAAILRLGLGVEEAAWQGDTAPLLFRVVYEDQRGATQDLFRRIVDPAHKPADRRWYDNDVDLSDLAGRDIRLRFVTEPVERDDTRTSLPVWSDPRVLAGRPGAKRPSIVLVSLGGPDAAPGTSNDGGQRPTSGRMAALAARGTLFERTVAGDARAARRAQLALLAEQLRRAGFATAAIVDEHAAAAADGFSSHDASGAIAGVGDVARTFGRAVAWAGRHVDEPFFLFVQTSGADDASAAQATGRRDDLLGRLVTGLGRLVPDEQLLLVIDTAGATGPLLFVWPGSVTAGRRIAEPAASSDVAPTILQLVGLPVPPAMGGQSLRPLLADRAATAPHATTSGAVPPDRAASARASAAPGDVR